MTQQKRPDSINRSRPYKQDVRDVGSASHALYTLRPVVFCYPQDVDPEATPRFGLLTEEVAETAPELVSRDERGRPSTVRYDAIEVMLLNEFLIEHCKVRALEAEVRQLKARLEKLEQACTIPGAEETERQVK